MHDDMNARPPTQRVKNASRRSHMPSTSQWTRLIAAIGLCCATAAHAQSFRVQCPTSTTLHPLVNSSGETGKPDSTLPNPHIKCQQISGGDGFATMGDGTQTYLFAFGPLSGLKNIVNGLPGTVSAAEFNQSNLDSQGMVLDVVKIGAPDGAAYPFNGAIGIAPDINAEQVAAVSFMVDPTTDLPINGSRYRVNDAVVFSGGGGSGATGRVSSVDGTGAITAVAIANPGLNYTSPPTVTITSTAGRGAQPIASLMAANSLDGHVDPRLIMDVGVLNGNIPAPMIAIDEGDELFLTLTNVGMVMRPDLFEQHTVHFHGYPNASAFYDGVPDASVAINIGGSFTYYYLAPEAGTYMWHCHISPPEHLQMGMVGQLYVRPRQNTVTSGSLKAALVATQSDAAAKCGPSDLLCTTQVPLVDTGAVAVAGRMYAYNDGDGSTAYDVEYPIQMHGFDPNFHFVGMTFNPESFIDNKDKYFLLNGRSYPDTINAAPMNTQSSDGVARFSQPLSAVVNIPAGGRALLRFSDLNVTEFHTLASLGIPMRVIGVNARLLRDQDGRNMAYDTNSITLGGGETIDVILDACMARAANGSCPAGKAYLAGQKFYLYTPQLDHLSNDAENFGGMMTEVNVCTAVNPTTKACS
jgi:FtsP/CotA-like multicopper oxidase with cupredoxin domain